MRYRRYRPLEELYGATERIPEAEITPVLQGVYRIQGPIDECDDELQSVNLGNFSVDERPESSACNVCSAPCSSCLHANQSLPFMESKIECDPSGSTSGRKEEDSCSSNGASEAVDKSKASDDNQHACAETSNLLSSTSSLDFCPENTFMKAASKEPVPCDPERSTKNEGSSLAGKVEAVTVGRQNCTASPMNEVNEADNKNPSLVSSENCDAYLGTENAKDNNVLSDEVNNCGFSDEQCEKDPNLAEDCKMEVLDVRQKTISESENSEEIEDDVKVCDICGDAGQEELLAFCSRCTDGAEHMSTRPPSQAILPPCRPYFYFIELETFNLSKMGLVGDKTRGRRRGKEPKEYDEDDPEEHHHNPFLSTSSITKSSLPGPQFR